MWPLELALWIAWIQLLGGLLIAAHVMKAAAVLWERREVTAARSHVADGVVNALGLMVAATLLKTLDVREWSQVAKLAVVMTMRITLKRHFARHVPPLAPVPIPCRTKRVDTL